MQKNLVLTLREVVEQTGLCETIGLKVVPGHLAQITLVQIDMKNTDDGASLVLLACHFFVNLGNLKVVKDALRKHKAD